MTNAKISKRALAVLKNKPLARAIAMAIAKKSYNATGDGFLVSHNGKEYTIKTISYLTEMDIKNASK